MNSPVSPVDRCVADGDFLRRALDAAGGIGTWSWDPRTDKFRADEAFWALHGGGKLAADAGDAARFGEFLALVVADQREALRDELHHAIQARRPFRREYQLASSQEGDRRILLRGASSGLDRDERLLGIATDITDQRQAESALRASEAKYEAITNSIDQMIWSTRPDGFHDYYNRRWYEYTGVPPGSTDGEAWNGMFHPEDRARAWEVWRRSLETGEPYHIEYRLRHRSGEYRWVIGRAQCVRGEDGAIARWYGTCTDIHDLKMAEQSRELIARELSHRIKNIFAVVSSLVMLPTRGRPEFQAFARGVQARIDAFAVAHEYVRPHSALSNPPQAPATVHGLLGMLSAPYNVDDAAVVAISGDDVPIGSRAATGLALIFHELATNAVKYGALSQSGGRVAIICARSEESYEILWEEVGGPQIDGAPERRGFGTALSERVVETELGAKMERRWGADGLQIRLIVPQARISL